MVVVVIFGCVIGSSWLWLVLMCLFVYGSGIVSYMVCYGCVVGRGSLILRWVLNTRESGSS